MKKNLGPHLTPVQKEVLILMCEDNTTEEIAKICRMKLRTVEGHRQKLREFFDVKSAHGVVYQAVKQGYCNVLEFRIAVPAVSFDELLRMDFAAVALDMIHPERLPLHRANFVKKRLEILLSRFNNIS